MGKNSDSASIIGSWVLVFFNSGIDLNINPTITSNNVMNLCSCGSRDEK